MKVFLGIHICNSIFLFFNVFLISVIFLCSYKPYLSLHFFHGYMKKLCFSHPFHQVPCSGAGFTTTVDCHNEGATKPGLTINIFSFVHWFTHWPFTATIRHQVIPEWGDSKSCHLFRTGSWNWSRSTFIKILLWATGILQRDTQNLIKKKMSFYLIKRKHHQR